MRVIPLLSSQIFVGPGILAGVGATLRYMMKDAGKAFILTDANCGRFARKIQSTLKQEGFKTTRKSIPAGEGRKKLATAAQLYDAMAEFRMDRQSLLVAIGGGMITDLGGFVASTYMRGIPAVFVPTSLGGQVDAAIGGKTGVNRPQGKNLVGTFTQPWAVFCDPRTLKTLPEREYVSGLGEVVKYGVIRDADLFQYISDNVDGIRRRKPDILDEIVHRCAAIKADVVGADETESGLRAILNYGHTIGHGLESAGGYSKLLHGEAVSIGMEAEAFLAVAMKFVSADTMAEQSRLLTACGLPVRTRALPPRKILDAIRLDKKGVAGKSRFVLPDSIGHVQYGIEVPPDLVKRALKAVTA